MFFNYICFFEVQTFTLFVRTVCSLNEFENTKFIHKFIHFYIYKEVGQHSETFSQQGEKQETANCFPSAALLHYHVQGLENGRLSITKLLEIKL